MDEKAAQLQETLSKLSRTQALALAKGVETQRALGQETLPTASILEALRPHLRAAGAPRVPTLCRLVCLNFEDFLTDRQDNPRPPGVIARAVIPPWWQAMQRLAATELKEIEGELKKLIAQNDNAGIVALAATAAGRAQGWTQQLLAQLRDRKGDAQLKKLFTDALFMGDVQELVRVLPLAPAIHGAIDAIVRVAKLHRFAENRRILDLCPEAVTEAKQHYLRLAETFGMDARYFALALLNRLERPWHVLRLGRALSWKPNDALVRDTEFGVIGERLIAELQVQTRDIVLRAHDRRSRDLGVMLKLITGYIDDAEGLLGEFGFRRESAWGEAILKTRVEVSQAIGADFLETVVDAAVAVLPQARRQGRRGGAADISQKPDEATIAKAQESARFLTFLTQKGQRHGFATAARDAIERIGEEIERRTEDVLGEVRTAADNLCIPAQIEAAAQVLSLLFEDGRGELLNRRYRNALQAVPRNAVYGVSTGR